jgi:hypothetical protein
LIISFKINSFSVGGVQSLELTTNVSTLKAIITVITNNKINNLFITPPPHGIS